MKTHIRLVVKSQKLVDNYIHLVVNSKTDGFE